MLFKNIMVTGCGGDIGFGIGKILKSTAFAEKLIGCDVHEAHPGFLVFDQCEILCRADHPDYLEQLSIMLDKHRIDALIPMSEAEIRLLHQLRLNGSLNGTPVIIPNETALEIGLDKLKTANFLKENHLSYPWTKLVKEGEPEAYPCIIKQRAGSGSKGFGIVQNPEECAYLRRKYPDSIFQEYLYPDDEEYTCGLYRTAGGETRCLTIKRKLGGGHTIYGEIRSLAAMDELLNVIAEKLGLQGSINVQLRLTEKGPVVFEINPRFSSTVVFRHLLGFQDLIWSLQEKAGWPPGDYQVRAEGTRFFRVNEEYIESQPAK